MPLRTLLRYLMNNEQLIEKVAESYPVRRAAQLTAYVFHRGKELGEDSLEKLRSSDMMQAAEKQKERGGNFSSTFREELQKGFKELKDEMKKNR